MPRAHQEIPTPLDVEDKLLFGLTARQFLYLVVGCSLAYGVWQQPALADGVRIGLAVACAACAAAVALVRPLGRPLEEWLAAGAFSAATPRPSTRRPPGPRPPHRRLPSGGWEGRSAPLGPAGARAAAPGGA